MKVDDMFTQIVFVTVSELLYRNLANLTDVFAFHIDFECESCEVFCSQINREQIISDNMVHFQNK